MKRRHVVATLSFLASASSAVYGRARKKQATFVLVHGAWHGGWCWKKVVPLLRAYSNNVYTPTLTGLGERSHLIGPQIDLEIHIQDIAAVLHYEDLHDVILVGHSYGGMVITGVADRERARINTLVYLDAFLPDDGKSLQDFASISLEKMAKESDSEGWRVPMLGGSVEKFGVSEKEDIRWMSSRVGVQPLKTFTSALNLSTPIEKSLRRVYVQLSEDRPYFNEAAIRAKQQGLEVHKFLEGGHDAMVTRPAELAKLLVEMRKH